MDGVTIDPSVLAEDLAALVRIPSVTGREREALAWLCRRAGELGLERQLTEHDLGALRAHPAHPGEEAPRTELLTLAITLHGTLPGRIALDGHVDVVGPGTEPWRHGPWSGELHGGELHGRGAVDMKGGVVAALHALAALKAAGTPTPEVVLLCVSGEEDGGLGTFAALELDDRFDACLIPEPTGFTVVCAQAGSLTFEGTVRGRAAHAAHRLEGRSAVDRYIAVHVAMAEHERRINAGVEHPAMRRLELPYPVNVGRVQAGEWSSSVPDRLVFEGRVGVRVGEEPGAARAAFEAAIRAADGEEPPVELAWTGGAFASGETDPGHPWVRAVRAAVTAERGEAPVAGVPWGADMRLFTARGIPTVMCGTTGIELAHAVDERVRMDEVAAVARIIARVVAQYAAR
ncbi:MAG TPA: M20/M25/M40 family metallo-hydrolase [Solirubrobacteraceae bacterium]|nr:M20/M25/M40 family metallo-hydrolase [Solirubrobacteraceae bacterium]